ncbi:MAG: xylulose kinase, partial [Caldilineaceae bacterium]|nr:xylulose kinase [Caldilineaceae bacterium]
MPSTGTDIILAIDLGTSGPKVALVTPAGEVLGWERESLASHFLPDGGVEQDPEEWWRTICQATRKLLARALAPVESIVALVVTAQWSGTV